MERLERFHMKVPTLLLPRPEFQNKWAVVACDQYTKQQQYWDNLKEEIGRAPSMLNLILPEIYLDDKKKVEEMIPQIHETMRKYLKDGVLRPVEGMVYLERRTRCHECRRGLVVALDLEHYEYKRPASALSAIRPTEGTIESRIPPRLVIRNGAPVESPHVMVLIDDPDRRLIEPLSSQKDQMELLYDTDLTANSGHIKGWRVSPSQYDQIVTALEHLADPVAFQKKYRVGPDVPLLLYAIGDGNHSLATAKKYWSDLKENCKTPAELEDLMHTHPARYALVEINNLYDEGIEFEPIHRVLFHVPDPLPAAREYFKEGYEVAPAASFEEMKERVDEAARRASSNHGFHVLTLPHGGAHLPVGALQPFLDQFMARAREANPHAEIDYIHGDEVVKAKGTEPDQCGFYLPAMSKHDLFLTVILNGVLPRKTFSMGHADEKRFYFECRAILP